MKNIYSSKIFIFSVLIFASINIFGGVYAEEEINTIDKDDEPEIVINEEETIVEETIKMEDIKMEVMKVNKVRTIPTELERLFIEGTSIAGETHTIKVDVRSSQKLLYRFLEKDLSTNKWTEIQNYSEKNTANWIPKKKGDYMYGVDIKEANSKKDSDISKYVPIRIEPSIPAELHSLDIIGTNEAKTTHKITASATGVNGVLYQFYIRDKITGSVRTIQSYSDKNTVEWTPEDTGSYEYGVNVKDKKSWEDKEDSKVENIEIVDLKPAVLESLELKGNKYEKNVQTLEAKATSTNGVLYKFFVVNEKTGATITLQNFSEKNTAAWTPNQFGQYSYYVAVKDKKSERNRDALLSYTVTINPPVHYKITEYNDTFEEALKKQNGVKSQNGKWVAASKEEISVFLKPDQYLQFGPSGKEGHILSVEIKSNALNVRSQPNTTSDIVATVSKGNIYVVLGEQNGWYKINTGKKQGWVSGDHVQYINDVPREMYQFMVLSGQVGVTTSQMNNELKGKGILEGQGAAFISGSQKYNVNELYLMAHSFLETGNGTSKLATGVWVDTVDGKSVPRRKVYNMYGIGAFDRDPLKHGSERAYTEGWFTPELAITEGANWISNSYINNPTHKQDTLYKMRFNPGNPGTHQYATDIAWAYKQISQIDRIMGYIKRMEGVVLKFDIPKYRK